MPKWSFSRQQKPADKPAVPPVPPAAKTARVTPPSTPEPAPRARRAADAETSSRSVEAQLDEAETIQARLRLDLAELLKAHRQQGRVLERNQKLLEQTELDLNRHRTRATALEAEIGEQRKLAEQHAHRVHELEEIVAKHATLETAYETLDRERQDLTTRLAEITRSRATAQTERDRLAGELASAHATIAARDAEIAALKVEQESVEARIAGLRAEAEAAKRASDGLRADLERALAISEMSRFKVGEGIAGWALSHREPVLVRDSRSDARFKASDPKHQPRSFIAVPLLADKEGLGVLTLARAASDPFTEHDLRNLARVATDAANALINARLVDLLKQREDRLTTLVRKARELSVANDSKQLVEFVLSSAKELIGGNAALLALRNPKSLELEVAGSQGVAEVIISQRIAWGAPAAGDVMRTGKPWVSLMREMLPPNLVETVETAGLSMIASVLCGSLREQDATDDGALLSRSEVEVSDEVSGVLNVYRDNLDPIPAGDLEQLKAFAEQASVAIQHVRRWDRVKEQLQATASMNTRLMGRERYINQLLFRIQQLETELSRYKAA